MRLILAAGATATAHIEGISGAGVDTRAMEHTPSADAELIAYGQLAYARSLPSSPGGCPTPAVVTRAVRELLGFDCAVIDAGLATPTGAPTVDVGGTPGGDIREPTPVPGATALFVAGRRLGNRLPDEELVVCETIPGGTTTAMGVLRALGETTIPVSSSLRFNPIDLKRTVVAKGLAASGLEPGDAEGRPTEAVETMGDPTLAVLAGLAVGALETGTTVTLGGGTQHLAVAALVRHAGIEAPLSLATTTYLADDVPTLDDAGEALDVSITVADPGFDDLDGGSLARFSDGEFKDGAGMGGALALAARDEVLDIVSDKTFEMLDRLDISNED